MEAAFETLQKPFDLHVLVCTNTRASLDKPSCGPLGSETIRVELKHWLQNELRSRTQLAGKIKVRVNGSGCLDFCKKGIVVALYPQSEFMLFVKNTPEGLQDVKNQIIAKLNELERR